MQSCPFPIHAGRNKRCHNNVILRPREVSQRVPVTQRLLPWRIRHAVQIAPEDTVGELNHRVAHVDDGTLGLCFHNLPLGLDACYTGWQDLQAIELVSVGGQIWRCRRLYS